MSNTPTITTQTTFTTNGLSLSYTVIVPEGTPAGTFTGDENKTCLMCFGNANSINSNIAQPALVITVAE